MSDIDQAVQDWVNSLCQDPSNIELRQGRIEGFKAGAQYKEREVAKKAYLLDKSVHERMSKYLEIIEHQAEQTDNLAEALGPFVQQYAHISDEELENVSGKFFFERMMNARTALKAYRGE